MVPSSHPNDPNPPKWPTFRVKNHHPKSLQGALFVAICWFLWGAQCERSPVFRFFSISLHSIYLWEIYGLWYGLLYMFIKLFLGYWWSMFREIRLSKSDESMGVWRQILTQDAISTPHECHVGDLPHAWLVTSRILLGKKRQLLGWWFFSWFGNKNNCIYIIYIYII